MSPVDEHRLPLQMRFEGQIQSGTELLGPFWSLQIASRTQPTSATHLLVLLQVELSNLRAGNRVIPVICV